MDILGIVPPHHDPSACVVSDGRIEAFVEQERMSREKHGSGEFPIEAIEEVLSISGLSITDIDRVVFSRNYKGGVSDYLELTRAGLRSSAGPLRKGFDSIVLPLREYTTTSGEFGDRTADFLSKHFGVSTDTLPPIRPVDHHRTHAASAFYPSGYRDALVISIDEHGDFCSTAVYEGEGSSLRLIESFGRFNSLGRLYGDVTEHVGFRRSNGEGKVMGLAPYGESNTEIASVLESYCSLSPGAYDVRPLTFRPKRDATSRLAADLGFGPRYWKDDIDQKYKDLAYHTQQLLEEIVVGLVEHYLSVVPSSNVCLAGGVALNCKMNKRIREIDGVDNMFVQPVANDAGGSIGACFETITDAGTDVDVMDHVYHGTAYSDAEIARRLDELKVEHCSTDDVPAVVARAIADGDLVGWFQGRMEAGPRALGNRSILADPRDSASLDRVNKYVKHREAWRPFAPSMLPEAAETYLDGEVSDAAKFMIDTYEVTEAAKEEIPAVLHPEDKTTRPQVVYESVNSRYHGLLQSFESRTGVGALLNTSFNDSGEPIVRTPEEAVRDFYSMGLDVLVLGQRILTKDTSSIDPA